MWNWERVGYSSYIILLFQMKPAVFFLDKGKKYANVQFI